MDEIFFLDDSEQDLEKPITEKTSNKRLLESDIFVNGHLITSGTLFEVK